MSSDPIALFLSRYDETIFGDYIELVANRGLLKYQSILQYGNKRGQSLYTHILDLICVLETLRSKLHLTDDESRVLFTAITIHDINKPTDERVSFNNVATLERLADEIRRLELEAFCPGWESYLQDITTLVRIHSGHYHVAGESWNLRRQPTYALGQERVVTLGHLIRAVDAIDLSHSLQERKHKEAFLGHLNAYLADSGIAEQYEFHTHQIVEQRGLLTNVMHNAIMDVLSEDDRLLPLLLYPDGVAYLAPKNTPLTIDEQITVGLSQAVTERINDVIADVEGLVDQTAQGIKIKPDALELMVPMAALWKQVSHHAARRNFKVEDLEANARERALKFLDAEQFRDYLESEETLISATMTQLRSSEMARSYFLFLSTYFGLKDDAWERIYKLLDLPPERYIFYNLFDPRWDRAYILAGDIWLSEEEVCERITEDSENLVESYDTSNASADLWKTYLERYVLVDNRPLTRTDWSEATGHYVINQHQQCVYCSGPFSTQQWMSGDVRDNITVQVFSNRLSGGGSKEPKKSICGVCRIQFLMEVLNFARVRGEDPFYLHLFPYSHLTTPYLRGLQATFNKLRNTDVALQALNVDVSGAMRQIASEHPVQPQIRIQTKQGKPQPYGVYVPHYSETIAGVMIFPVNPAGTNDTEKYLFALWNALVLQRYFGVKVLMSKSPVPPMEAEALPDVYLDMVPLSCEGLLPRNDFLQFIDNQEGPLAGLWQQVTALFALRRLLFTTEDDTPALVRAMSSGPLHLFFTVDRIAERKDIGSWIGREALPYLQHLAISLGGSYMEKLSEQLKQAAEIAWKHGLRGATLKRNSLLYPAQEVLDKMALLGGEPDRETIIAATTQDIFAHLERIAGEYKPGRTKLDASEQFVRIWYEGILDGVYNGSRQKLLSDKKLILSAYLFYIQAEIPRKAANPETLDSTQLESEEV